MWPHQNAALVQAFKLVQMIEGHKHVMISSLKIILFEFEARRQHPNAFLHFIVRVLDLY